MKKLHVQYSSLVILPYCSDYVYVSVWQEMRECRSLFKKLPTSTFPSPPVFLPPYPGSMESLPQPTASFFFQLPTKVKNQCESLKKESAQRTESQAKAPGCRLRKKLPLGKDLLPGFARLFFLGQTEFFEANNRVAGRQGPFEPPSTQVPRMDFMLFLYAFFFFPVDVVFHFSRLREGKSVSSLMRRRGGERGEKHILSTWKEWVLCLCISFLSVGHICTSVL